MGEEGESFMRRIAVLAALAAVVIIALAAFLLAVPKPGFPGSRAILDNQQINEAVASGRPTIIYFSSPNCPTCMLQDKAMDQIFTNYSSSVNFVYLKHSQGLSKVFEEWSVFKVPTLVFVDKNGAVVSRYDGEYLNEEALRSEIERLL